MGNQAASLALGIDVLLMGRGEKDHQLELLKGKREAIGKYICLDMKLI
jgi:hypothetical protein